MRAERRSCPRYPVDFQISVTIHNTDDGEQAQSFTAQALNLSRTSIEFRCGDGLVSVLLGQRELPYTCELELSLPWDEHVFALDGQVVTHRRISQFQYVVALVLKHQDEEQENLLDTLLSQRLRGSAG